MAAVVMAVVVMAAAATHEEAKEVAHVQGIAAASTASFNLACCSESALSRASTAATCSFDCPPTMSVMRAAQHKNQSDVSTTRMHAFHVNPFINATVIYLASSGVQLPMSRCSLDDFGYQGTMGPDQNGALDLQVDWLLQTTEIADYWPTAPATFKTCVSTQAVLGESNFTQAVIDAGATSDLLRRDVCRHHFRRCYMQYSADPAGDGSGRGELDSASASYQIAIPYQGKFYNYTVRMQDCGIIIHANPLARVARGFDFSSKIFGARHVNEGGYESPAMLQCFLHEEAVKGEAFEDLRHYVFSDSTIGTQGRYVYAHLQFCHMQRLTCERVYEYERPLYFSSTAEREGCVTQMLPKCRGALKHLKAMLLRDDPEEQQCNNFALKSIRAYFHDWLSADIDGSLLWELNHEHNVGLCKWAQYVNTLSDITGCDPGTITNVAAMLGFKACGMDVWGKGSEAIATEEAFAAPQVVTIGRGYECKTNYNPFLDEQSADGRWHRKSQLFDMSISSDGGLMEDFWWAAQSQLEPQNAVLFYTAAAWAGAHAIGRVRPNELEKRGPSLGLPLSTHTKPLDSHCELSP